MEGSDQEEQNQEEGEQTTEERLEKTPLSEEEKRLLGDEMKKRPDPMVPPLKGKQEEEVKDKKKDTP